MKQNSRIYVAGHLGLVGSAIERALTAKGFTNLILKTRKELDLLDQRKTAEFFKREKPEFVFLSAAKVGGIMANKSQPSEFIYENLMVQANVLESARKNGVKKLLFLGSSCIYPRACPQPIKEEYLLSGPLEPTNRAYAIAKISGIITCESYREEFGANYISAIPTNMYGPNDNFHKEDSHVLPALIHKFHEAKASGKKEVTLWGSGKAEREFLHVDDFADAAFFLMENYNDGKIINVGVGKDISIKALAELIKKITGFTGKIKWDTSKPDGSPKKLLDISKITKLGWQSKIPLEAGIRETYEWYIRSNE